MSYSISEQLISYNRSHKSLYPQGFVIHSTDDPGATSQNEHDYFNGGDRQASAHYFSDWNGNTIIRTIPENEQAWHAGPTANSRFLSVEMCVPSGSNSTQFQQVWDKTVWLVADACVRYNWNSDVVWSHKGVSDTWHETDHQDPYAFIQSYGKSWQDMLNAIDAEIQNIKGNQNNNNGGNFRMDTCIVYFSPSDFSSAIIIANKYGKGCAMFCRNSSPNVHPDAMKASKVFNIGGPKLNVAGEIYLSGASAGDTLIAVANYLQVNK